MKPKKISSNPKFALKRETLRRLTAQDLEVVLGGERPRSNADSECPPPICVSDVSLNHCDSHHDC